MKDGACRMTKHDDYRRQTEEDLESVPPMSTTQKVIIAIAAIGVAVGIAFCTFVSRFAASVRARVDSWVGAGLRAIDERKAIYG